MPFAETFIGKLLAMLGSSVFGWLGSRATNATLTGAQQEQNYFNSQEAAQQRAWSTSEREASQQFNSVEAQKNRDFQASQVQQQMNFQKEMDSSVYQRRVADMQAAGINPALAVGGVSVGATNGAAAAGSAASSSPGSGAAASGSNANFSMSDLMAAARLKMELDEAQSRIKNNDADALMKFKQSGLLDAQTKGQQLSNSWFEPMKEAEYASLISSLQNDDVKRALDRQHIKESEAYEAFHLSQVALAHIDAQTRDELNRASISRTIASAALDTGLLRESKHRVKEIDANIALIYQRVITESALAGYYSSEDLRAMEDADLIRVKRYGEEQNNKIREVQVNNRKLTYYLGVGSQAAGIIGDIAGGAGRLIGGIAVGSRVKNLNLPGPLPQRSGLILPKGFSEFNTQYGNF